MEKILDNKRHKIIDVLQSGIAKGAKISTISAYFTIYAFDALREQLRGIDNFRFLFVEPTFIKEKEKKREFYIKRLDREKRLPGTEFEIRLKNELTQSKIAKECADWIREKADFRSLKKSDKFSSKLFHVQNKESKDFSVHGSIDFTSSGLGTSASRRLEMSQYSDDTETTNEMLEWFDEIWNSKELVEDVKNEVLKSIEVIYHENSPELLYFVTLYNIFSDYLSSVSEEGPVKEKTVEHCQMKLWVSHGQAMFEKSLKTRETKDNYCCYIFKSFCSYSLSVAINLCSSINKSSASLILVTTISAARRVLACAPSPCKTTIPSFTRWMSCKSINPFPIAAHLFA